MTSCGFEKVSRIQDSFYIGKRLLHVESMYALIQAIGYMKFQVEKESDGHIRGQE